MNQLITVKHLPALFAITFTLLTSFPLLAADCSQAEIILTTQAQVDSFQTDHGGEGTCDTVTGDLWIVGENSITDLSGLSDLSHAGSALTIRDNFVLTNLDGLSNLIDVGGNLTVTSNSSLSNCEALSSLLDEVDDPPPGPGPGVAGIPDVGGDVAISGNLTGCNLTCEPEMGLVCPPSSNPEVFIDGLDVQINGSVLTPDPCESVTNIRWDWGDGSGSDSFFPAQHTYPERADYTISATALDASDNEIVSDACYISMGTCSQSDISLSSQVQVDSFHTDYGNGGICDTVAGELQIHGADITNLDGLSGIRSVGGSLTIEDNPSLTTLDGLSSLASTGSGYYYPGIGLYIVNNPSLTSLAGLSGLTTTGGTLRIERNTILPNLDGLSGITNVSGHLWIQENDTLANLDSLSGVTNVGGDLNIGLNYSLTSLVGLSGITNVDGDLAIGSANSLTSLDGLSGITSVGASLFITYNAVLPNLDGLSSLTSVGGALGFWGNNALSNIDSLSGLSSAVALWILWNNSLVDLNGLSDLTSIAFDVVITDNVSLSHCSALSKLLDDVDDMPAGPGPGSAGIPDVGSDVTLSGNRPGCNALDEIDTLFSDSFEEQKNIYTLLDEEGVGSSNAIAIGFDGNPVISYRDQFAKTLKYAKCLTRLCTASAITIVDDSGDVGLDSSIDIGADGTPVISYYDGISGALKVAKCNDVRCTTAIVTTVDDSNNVGRFTSITIGDDEFPVISYRDMTAETLKVAKCENASCTLSTITTVDDLGNVGNYNSIAIGHDGFPVISYHDGSASKLKVIKCNDAACSGGDEVVSTVNDYADFTGIYTAIAIGTDGNPVIVYLQTTPPAPSTVRVAKCNDPACADGDEIISILDNTGIAMHEPTDIVIGSDGLPVLTYFDFANQELKVIKCNDATCSGGDEKINVVDGLTRIGSLSIDIGDDGMPVISVWDGLNDGLGVVHCGTSSCK